MRGTIETLTGYEEKTFTVRAILGLGLRVGELAALRLADCDTDRVTIRRSNQKTDTTKANGVRIVKVMPEFLPHYQRRVAELSALVRPPEYLMLGVVDRTLQNYWKEILAESGVRRLSIQKGRHTYATHELQSGRLTMIQLRCQLGHSLTSKNTEKYYLHAAPDYIYPSGEPAWRLLALNGTSVQK